MRRGRPSCLAAGLRLTDGTERDRIRDDRRRPPDGIADDDLAVLGYGQFLAQLEAGIAAHHAGMVPAFKEVVEACFTEGLIKAVFATETLAVGINMPARTVVIEKLTKFTGDHHEMLTPGEYTQLTGRAGRRGIDEQGHAVVLWSPFVPFDQVATLAPAARSTCARRSGRPTTWPPTSSAPTPASRPTTCSTCRSRSTSPTATSCASRPGWSGCGRNLADAGAGREPVRRHLGLPPALDEIRSRRRGRDDLVAIGMARLRPGEVIHAVEGQLPGPGRGRGQRQPQGRDAPTTVTTRGDLLMLTAADFGDAPRPLGTVRLPTVFSPEPQRLPARGRPCPAAHQLRRPSFDGRRRPVSDGAHAVESDPDLRQRMRAAGQTERLDRELVELTSRRRARAVAGSRVRPRARRARSTRLRRRGARGR